MEFVPDRKESESNAAETTDVNSASVAKDNSDTLSSGLEEPIENTLEPSSEEVKETSTEQVTEAPEDTPSEGTGEVSFEGTPEASSEGSERPLEVTPSENGAEAPSQEPGSPTMDVQFGDNHEDSSQEQDDSFADLSSGDTEVASQADTESAAVATLTKDTLEAPTEESETLDGGPPSWEEDEDSPAENEYPPEQTVSPVSGWAPPSGFRYRLSQMFSRRKITISLDKDVIRVVVFRGRKVLAWGTAQMRDSDTDEEKDREQDTVSREGESTAERLSTLLRHLGVQRGRVVTDLPLHAPLMRHLQLPKMRRRFRDDVVKSEIMETIPFSEEQVDLAWQARSSGQGHDVFAIAVSKSEMASQIRLLTDAGLRPRAAYAKATALAHAANITDGIVVHVGPCHAAFVLVHQSVPRVVHEVELGDKYSTPEEQAEVISKTIKEVAGFAQTLDSAEESQYLPVVLTGQVAKDGPLAQELQQALQIEMLTIAPPFVYPEHFPPSEYAANIGLALADEAGAMALGRGSDSGVPSFNLIPERYLPHPLPAKPVAVFTGLLVLATLSIIMGNRIDSVAAESTALSADLVTMRTLERENRLASARAEFIGGQTLAITGLTQNLEVFLADSRGDLNTILLRLEAFTHRALPPEVTLATIKPQGDTFAFSGTAPSYQDLIRYTDNLRSLGLFSSVRIQQASGTDTIAFQAAAEIASTSNAEGDS